MIPGKPPADEPASGAEAPRDQPAPAGGSGVRLWAQILAIGVLVVLLVALSIVMLAPIV